MSAAGAGPVPGLFRADRMPGVLFEGWHRPAAAPDAPVVPRFDRMTAEEIVARTRIRAGSDPGPDGFTWDGTVLLATRRHGEEVSVVRVGPDADGLYLLGPLTGWCHEVEAGEQDRRALRDRREQIDTVFAATYERISLIGRRRNMPEAFGEAAALAAARGAVEMFLRLRPVDEDAELDPGLLEVAELGRAGHGDPRAPYTWARLTASERARLMGLAVTVACVGPVPAPCQHTGTVWVLDGEPLARMLSMVPDPTAITSIRVQLNGTVGLTLRDDDPGTPASPTPGARADQSQDRTDPADALASPDRQGPVRPQNPVVDIRLTTAQAEDLGWSFRSAERGREYTLPLGSGPADGGDQAGVSPDAAGEPDGSAWAARARHERERRVEQDVRRQIHDQANAQPRRGDPGCGGDELIGLIEWPSDSAAFPDLLLGARSPAELDRMFVDRLQQAVGTPDPGDRSGEELRQYVLESGWPPVDAGDQEVLDWLIGLRSALISTCCTMWRRPPGRGLAEAAHAGRYDEDVDGDSD